MSVAIIRIEPREDRQVRTAAIIGGRTCPVLLEMIFWAAQHEETVSQPSETRRIAKRRDDYLGEIRSHREKSWSGEA